MRKRRWNKQWMWTQPLGLRIWLRRTLSLVGNEHCRYTIFGTKILNTNNCLWKPHCEFDNDDSRFLKIESNNETNLLRSSPSCARFLSSFLACFANQRAGSFVSAPAVNKLKYGKMVNLWWSNGQFWLVRLIIVWILTLSQVMISACQ